jgi:hypothetical protein
MLTFFHPGSRGQKGTRSRIRIRNTAAKYAYIKSTTVYVPSSELGLSQPLSRQQVCPFPQNRGGAHSPAGEGLGEESQFRRLEKKLSTLPTLWYHPSAPEILETSAVQGRVLKVQSVCFEWGKEKHHKKDHQIREQELGFESIFNGLYHRERILETSTLSCNEEEEEITKPPKR